MGTGRKPGKCDGGCPAFHRRHRNRPLATDLTNSKPRRSLVRKREGTVMNDNPNQVEPSRGPGQTRWDRVD